MGGVFIWHLSYSINISQVPFNTFRLKSAAYPGLNKPPDRYYSEVVNPLNQRRKIPLHLTVTVLLTAIRREQKALKRELLDSREGLPPPAVKQ